MHMLHINKWARKLALGTAISASTAMAYAVDDKPAVDRDTLVVAVEKEFQNLDGLVTISGDSLRYGWQIYDTLYGFDRSGNLEPHLATAIKVSDDAKTFTYTLRSGVKFHNGDTLTSADVKASLEHILDPAAKSTRRPYFAPIIDSVETPDAQTVVFKLKQPDGAFQNKIAGYLYIVPAKYLASLASPDAFAQAPVSLGPYKVKRYVPGGSELELERFEDYYGEKPQIKHLIFKAITEPASRVNAILRGEVDAAVVLPFPDYPRLQKEKGLEVIKSPVASPLYVRIYTTDPALPTSKKEVRQALSYALDTPTIIKTVLNGVGEPLGTFISRYYPYGSDASIKPYPYDPAKARELLKAAGYPNGLTLRLTAQGDLPKELSEAIAAYWGQVGIKTEINRLTYAGFQRVNNTHASGPLALSQFTNAIYDPIHPVGGAFAKDGSWSDYYNPKVEALLQQVGTVADREGRDRLFKQIGSELHDDAAGVFLSEYFYVYAKKDSVKWDIQQGSGFLNFKNAGWK